MMPFPALQLPGNYAMLIHTDRKGRQFCMELLYFLEKLRSPVLDRLCILLSMLGEETVFLTVGLILLWCVDKQWGYRYMMCGFFSSGLSRLLKGTLQVPRPFTADPSFSFVSAAEDGAPGYSLPSGHSMTAATVFGIPLCMAKRWWFRALCVLAIAGVAFARMELGVHTLTDCIAGIGLGFGVILILNAVYDRIHGDLNRLTLLTLLMMAGMAAVIALLTFAPHSAHYVDYAQESCIKKTWVALGCMAGVSVSYLTDRLYTHYDTKAVWWVQVIKVAAGVGLLLAVQAGINAVVSRLAGQALYKAGLTYFLTIAIVGSCYPMSFRWLAASGAALRQHRTIHG